MADPGERALAAGLVQPDTTTCGSSVLVVARMLADPAYASFLADGTHALAGVPADGDVHDRFAREVLAMHRLARRVSRARGLGRVVVAVPLPGAAGRGMRDGSLTLRGAGTTGRQTFDDWLRS